MSDIRLLSLNTKGLGTPEKRTALLRELWKQRAKIIFLQETHFCKSRIPKLSDRHYPTVFHSPSADSKSKGVSILLSGALQWETKEVLSDEEGRSIFLKGSLGGKIPLRPKLRTDKLYCKHLMQARRIRRGRGHSGGGLERGLGPNTGHYEGRLTPFLS